MALKGKRAHLNRLKRLSGADVAQVANAVVYEGADIIRAEASRLITAGSVSGKNHVASRPGEPPQNDTGNLRNQIGVSQKRLLEAEVRSEAAYASALEFGSSKMAARPYMRVARDNKVETVRRRMVAQMNKLVKRSG